MKKHTRYSQTNNIPTTPTAFLWFVTKPYFWGALLTLLFVIAGSASSQSLTLFFKWIVEAIEQQNVQSAFLYGLLYPVAVFGSQVLFRLSSVVAGQYWFPQSRRYTNDVLVEYTTGHSHSYFANRFAGALLTKINNVNGAVESLLHDFVWSYLTLIISLIVSVYFIATVDVLAAVILVVLVTGIVTVNRLMMHRKRVLSRETAAAASKMRGVIVDVFGNMSAVRQYTTREYEREYISTLTKNWENLGRKNWLYTDLTQAINAVILFVCSGLMFYVLVARWEAGLITSAEFIFVLAIIAQLTGSLIFIGRMMVTAARVAGEMEEGLKEIVVPYELMNDNEATALSVTTGAIKWEEVNFEYGENKVFTDFNLTIPSGQRVGLVGSSGAGKTTFVSLLLRQHELGTGAITIDGQDIATVTQDSLRANISVVPQEPALFHRTIRENIAYGKSEATDEEVIAVAKKAQAHEFISALPEGYSTLVGERGIKLSGGQKQRIAIARAMLKDAPILILDEATSALDSESEVLIQKALHALMAGKTVIAIAHRLSTLREMDRIIVLEEGKIIEDGTHETLRTSGSTYQRLWEHQAGGFMLE
jgi:ATP-binding cassette, subfamily B, bacterial